MYLKKSYVFAALVLIAALASGRAAFAADDLNSVLSRLDAAAKTFKSTSADVEFDTVQTVPVPDTDVLTGTVDYQRSGTNFQMAAHIAKDDNQPATKVYTYSNGVFKLYEGGSLNQVTTFKRASDFASYVMLGFGASGKDLSAKWDMKYLGAERVDGVNTAKLELVAKDPTVRTNIPKVTIWIDTARAVSIKQIFDEGPGQSRTSHYTNIKVNQSLPGDAFKLPTDSKTTYVNR